jgi:hypothetical protein
MAHNRKVSVNTPTKIKAECLVKGVDPLEGEYIDLKLEIKFENIYPEWKKNINE